MRILVTLAQDSPELLDIALYCRTHGILLSRECWHVNQKEFEFYLIHAEDSAHLHWLYLAYPGRFVPF
jgi:hypothetical protein